MKRTFVSYAQNLEDVMLWRALGHVERGFYIDVGAWAPDRDSVTRAFYDRGWRGINVEPHPEYHRQLLASRSRDINLQVALGDRAGDVTMHFVGDTGLSTIDVAEAAKRVREGFGVVDEVVAQETLAAICAQHVSPDQPVHFLKVDVEGSERAVLLGVDWDSCRPWIVVVEATRPNTQEPSHQEWEGILTSAGYGFVYGDGLNWFYLATERGDLRPAFALPPNIFDHFVRAAEVESRARATRAEARLAAILTTRTWRYTRPLRVATKLARRARAKGRRLSGDARRAIKERSTTVRTLFPIDRGNPGLSRNAAILKKAPGVLAFGGRRSEASTSERRLIIDVSSLDSLNYGTGIQCVVRSMVTWLPSVLPSAYRMEPAYAAADGRGYRRARWVRPEGATGRIIVTDTALDPRPGDVFLGLDLRQRAVSANSGFYSALQRSGIPVYFVVYDLLPVLMPHRFVSDVAAIHRRWLEVVAAADGAICISGAVANELRSWVKLYGPDRRSPLRIGSFHLGANVEDTDHTYGMPDDAAETLRSLAARPTFLLVGTLEPRKGHVQTLEAFERLWDEQTDVNLAFVGKIGWHMEPFVARLSGHPEIGKRLFWMEGISDQYLDQVYRTATCLIAPSEGEGFGLPLIEAAQHGTPLLVRDIPVFREVAGDYAFYFGGLDASSLSKAVHEWLTLWRDGQHPRSNEMPWLTWEESARQMVAVLFDELSRDRLPVAGVA